MKTKLAIKSAPLLCVLCAPALILADDDSVDVDQLTIGIDQAMSIAMQEVPGTVTEAELEKEQQKLVWEIEIVTAEKQIFEVEVDAQTGAVLDVEEDD